MHVYKQLTAQLYFLAVRHQKTGKSLFFVNSRIADGKIVAVYYLAHAYHCVIYHAVSAVACHCKHIVIHRFVEHHYTLLVEFVYQRQIIPVLQRLFEIEFFAGVTHLVCKYLLDGSVVARQKFHSLSYYFAVLLPSHLAYAGSATTPDVVIETRTEIFLMK